MKHKSYILLTPSEGLSKQHLKELKESNISAERYSRDKSYLLSDLSTVQVIENSKLADEDGEKEVSIESFKNDNILFVDEGHRGSSGEKWYHYRRRLGKNGFTFEYSATFSQAVSQKNKLFEEYAKCIIFDYSYRYFYKDGYGKDYNILNISQRVDERSQNMYLVAALLSFYQQKKVYQDNNNLVSLCNIANPLLVFVGSRVTVNASKSDKSDVVKIISFLKFFLQNKDSIARLIDRLLSNEDIFLTQEGENIFSNSFDYLKEIKMDGKKIYSDMLDLIFNSKTNQHNLIAENLRSVDGEIRLKCGENDPFGVINVGSDNDLLKLLAAENIKTRVVSGEESLFQNLDSSDSTVNILIGSRKFTEGWNSWRVSSMGLMNIGRNEGSQIIQLFGRGVRLKGRKHQGKYSLKRSSNYHHHYIFEEQPSISDFLNLHILETLNVFGLRADYMDAFKKYLEDEGVEVNNEYEDFIIPTKTMKLPEHHLKVLALENGVNYESEGKEFGVVSSGVNKVTLDTYGKIQFQSSVVESTTKIKKHVGILNEKHLKGINFERLYLEALDYKRRKGYSNILFNYSDIKYLFNNPNWYKLYILEKDLEINSFKDYERIEGIALTLLKKHINLLVKNERKKFESSHLTLIDLSNEHANFLDQYLITVSKNQKKLIQVLKDYQKSNTKAELEVALANGQGSLSLKNLNYSLFNPLLYISSETDEVKSFPAALVESEKNLLTF